MQRQGEKRCIDFDADATVRGLGHEAADIADNDEDNEDVGFEVDDEEELPLGERFEKNLDATQLYLNEIGFSPLLTPEEEVKFSRMAQPGEQAGRHRMIATNRRLMPGSESAWPASAIM